MYCVLINIVYCVHTYLLSYYKPYYVCIVHVPSLAGQPLHKEEGSDTVPLLKLFVGIILSMLPFFLRINKELH